MQVPSARRISSSHVSRLARVRVDSTIRSYLKRPVVLHCITLQQPKTFASASPRCGRRWAASGFYEALSQWMSQLGTMRHSSIVHHHHPSLPWRYEPSAGTGWSPCSQCQRPPSQEQPHGAAKKQKRKAKKRDTSQFTIRLAASYL